MRIIAVSIMFLSGVMLFVTAGWSTRQDVAMLIMIAAGVLFCAEYVVSIISSAKDEEAKRRKEYISKQSIPDEPLSG